MTQKADEVHNTFLTASQSEWPSSRNQKTKKEKMLKTMLGKEELYSTMMRCKHVWPGLQKSA